MTHVSNVRVVRAPRVLARAQRWYPLRRLGGPEDVADISLFLGSDEASWVTSTALVVDGRLTGGNAVVADEIVWGK